MVKQYIFQIYYSNKEKIAMYVICVYMRICASIDIVP
nr:MAG TPA: hypothetical protein [Caudoviricetes sp.]